MHEALSRSCPTPRRSELSLADVAEIFVNRAPRTDLTIGKDKVVKLNNVTIRTSGSNLTAVFACGLTVQSTLVLQSMTVETLLTSDYEGRISGKSFEKAETVFWVDKSLAEPACEEPRKSNKILSQLQMFASQAFSGITIKTRTTICATEMAPSSCL